jgi:hypothetical protein
MWNIQKQRKVTHVDTQYLYDMYLREKLKVLLYEKDVDNENSIFDILGKYVFK